MLNRRNMLAGATGATFVTVAASSAVAAPQPDATIRALFQQWIDLRQAIGSFPDDREDGFDALVEQEEALAVSILRQPAEGLTGFGMKAFVAAASKLPATFRDHVTVQVPAGHGDTAEGLSEFALAMDAVRLIPEVAVVGSVSASLEGVA